MTKIWPHSAQSDSAGVTTSILTDKALTAATVIHTERHSVATKRAPLCKGQQLIPVQADWAPNTTRYSMPATRSYLQACNLRLDYA